MNKSIGILTSGGDAPGMNATIRAVVRQADAEGLDVMGFERGYRGVLERRFRPLNPRSVGNILQTGGTILRTARCPEFTTEEGLKKAAVSLRELDVSGLIVIGGNGSLTGAQELAAHWDGQIIGLPGTIDNDLAVTDFTIGFDTAVNTALESIDRIRDTAEAHDRFFLIEVMGRDTGFIANEVGLAGGAEEILVPGGPIEIEAICRRLCAGRERGKNSSILVVAEGAYPGGAMAVAEELKKLSGNDYRVCVLGHVQRGGRPTARDRTLATRLGSRAVTALAAGETQAMIGECGGEIASIPLEEAIAPPFPIPASDRTLTQTMAR